MILTPGSEDPLLPELDRAIDVAGVLAFTGGGALLGGVVGAFIRSDRWEPVPPSGVQWGAAPAPEGGLALGIRVPFAGSGLTRLRGGAGGPGRR